MVYVAVAPSNDIAVVMSFERKYKTDKEVTVEFDSHIKGILSHHFVIIVFGHFQSRLHHRRFGSC